MLIVVDENGSVLQKRIALTHLRASDELPPSATSSPNTGASKHGARLGMGARLDDVASSAPTPSVRSAFRSRRLIARYDSGSDPNAAMGAATL